MGQNPRVFVASSSESSARVAHPLKQALEAAYPVEVRVWDEKDFSPPGKYFLDSIKRYLVERSDFGIFVFAPDDAVTFRESSQKATRDNVILELGMCIGILGRERSFVLAPEALKELRIPSDLLGLELVSYDEPLNRPPDLAAACRRIVKHIKELGFFPRQDENIHVLNPPAKKSPGNDDSLLMITDPDKLLMMYYGEVPIGSDLPYSQLKSWEVDLDPAANEPAVRVEYDQQPFELKYRSVSHKLFQVQAYAQLEAWDRIKQNNPMLRLRNWTSTTEDNFCITIQQACYADQIQSNMVLHWPTEETDWEGRHGLASPFKLEGNKHRTLSDLLLLLTTAQTPSPRLPTPDDPAYEYLANTIGVSVILFYKKENGWLPIIQDRTIGDVAAVYNKGLHVSVSFALGFDRKTAKDARSLGDLVDPRGNSQLSRKLFEEARIYRKEVCGLRPLALCREFMRGGKPQLFYAGYVAEGVNEEEIARRFEQTKKPKPRTYASVEEMNDALCDKRKQFTTEFAANWHYCVEKYLPRLAALKP